MEGYGRPPGDPWDRGNPPAWDRESFQRDWYDRERGIQPNTWEGPTGAPVEAWDKRGVPRDGGFASAADQQWERGRMVDLEQGSGQWDMEERHLGRDVPRREDRFGERERQGGRDPYYDRERGNERERLREADLGRSRRSHSSERSRGRSRDHESRREYRRRSRSRSRSRSRERRRERDDERRRRNIAEPEPSTIIMMRNLRSSVTEDDISKVLGDKHSQLREVRLIRDRGGTSKGFAFLEFFRLEDARMWLESNKNDFYIQGGLVSLEYSRQRFHDRDRHGRDDWTCFKCNTRNFRNIYCSTCECSRHESESLNDERGRDPAKSLERESNPPSQNDGAAFAFQRVGPPHVSRAIPPGSVPNIGVPSVPGDLVQKIRSGSFVDASELLPELFDVASYEGEMRGGDRNLYSVNSPIDWAVCFTTYASLLCSVNPTRAHELFSYMGIVLQIARSLPGDEWLRYDRTFRQMAVVNPTLPWAELDYRLWLSITQPSGGLRHVEGAYEPEPFLRARSPTPPPLMAITAADRAFSVSHSSPPVNPTSRHPLLPQPATERERNSLEWGYPRRMPDDRSRFLETSARLSLADKEVCHRWNETRCDVLGCPMAHVCRVCRSGHHRGRDCPEKQRGPPERMASASPIAPNQSLQVCRNWNADKCFFKDCKFLHACIHCKSSDHRGPDCSTIAEPEPSPAKLHDICKNWNAGKCFFRDCRFLHACIHCKSSDHRGPDCPTVVEPAASAKIEEICKNWNAGKCFFRDCRFLHACIHCKSTDHRGPDCPTVVEPAASAKTQDICRNWNAGKCFFRDCRFLHACTHCKSTDHRGPDCPATAEPASPTAKLQDICKNWNAGKCFFKECRFLHACIHCKVFDHKGPDCPKNQPASSAAVKDAPVSNAPPGDTLASDVPAGSTSTRDPPASTQAVCKMWNNGWCFLKGCKYLHVCSRCRSTTHKAPNCLAQQDDGGGDDSREICMNWNADKCSLSRCMFLHACSVCRSAAHTARNCRTVTVAGSDPKESAKDSEVCRKWNLKSCIGGTECRKLHVCLLCKTPDHNALSCPRLGEGKSGLATSDSQLSQSICRNWNYKHCFMSDCQYKHLCMLCTSPAHPATLCPTLRDGDESEGSKDASAQCCRDWNNGRCIFKGCRFRHACFRCRSMAHKVVNCPYA